MPLPLFVVSSQHAHRKRRGEPTYDAVHKNARYVNGLQEMYASQVHGLPLYRDIALEKRRDREYPNASKHGEGRFGYTRA